MEATAAAVAVASYIGKAKSKRQINKTIRGKGFQHGKKFIICSYSVRSFAIVVESHAQAHTRDTYYEIEFDDDDKDEDEVIEMAVTHTHAARNNGTRHILQIYSLTRSLARWPGKWQLVVRTFEFPTPLNI